MVFVPCEVVHWHLLPALTAGLTQALAKRKQSNLQIAKLLGITPASVSYYLQGKRGKGVKLSSHVQKNLDALAASLVKGGPDELLVSGVFCDACKHERAKLVVCHLHKTTGKAPKNCTVCSVHTC